MCGPRASDVSHEAATEVLKRDLVEDLLSASSSTLSSGRWHWLTWGLYCQGLGWRIWLQYSCANIFVIVTILLLRLLKNKMLEELIKDCDSPRCISSCFLLRHLIIWSFDAAIGWSQLREIFEFQLWMPWRSVTNAKRLVLPTPFVGFMAPSLGISKVPSGPSVGKTRSAPMLWLGQGNVKMPKNPWDCGVWWWWGVDVVR